MFDGTGAGAVLWFVIFFIFIIFLFAIAAAAFGSFGGGKGKSHCDDSSDECKTSSGFGNAGMLLGAFVFFIFIIIIIAIVASMWGGGARNGCERVNDC